MLHVDAQGHLQSLSSLRGKWECVMKLGKRPEKVSTATTVAPISTSVHSVSLTSSFLSYPVSTLRATCKVYRIIIFVIITKNELLAVTKQATF